jgi:hypothetical protein
MQWQRQTQYTLLLSDKHHPSSTPPHLKLNRTKQSVLAIILPTDISLKYHSVEIL